MPENDDSELLNEGIRTYRKVLFAIGEFRREMHERVRKVLDPRLDQLASAMTLDVDAIRTGLTVYSNPSNISQDFDGSYAVVGWKCEPRGQPWQFFAHWYVDEKTDPGNANVSLKLRPAPRELALRKIESLSLPDWYAEDGEIYVSVPLEGTDANAIDLAFNGAIDRAVSLWGKVGGISQFLVER